MKMSVSKTVLQRLLRNAALALCATAVVSVASAQSGAPASGGSAPRADAPGAAPVRAGVEAWLKGRYKVEELRRTPVPGIWEVRIGNDLIYVDDKGQHAFVEGNLVDMRSNRNLTRERVDELLTIDFRELPLNIAMKQVIGNGKRTMAVFEDPNCGYCRQMRKDIANLKDVTIYTFVIPILSPDSEVKAKKALCADDKVRAWTDMMVSGKVPGNAGTCETPLAKMRELAQKLGVSATPTTFFPNGKRLQGYVPAAQLDKMLDENSKS
jgi:thiol:disulfide interchange protein DsbC